MVSKWIVPFSSVTTTILLLLLSLLQILSVVMLCSWKVQRGAAHSMDRRHSFWLVAWHSGRTPVFAQQTFPVPKITAARMSTKLDKKCSTMSPGNPFLGAKRSKSQGTQNSAGVGFCTLVSAGFFLFCFCGMMQDDADLNVRTIVSKDDSSGVVCDVRLSNTSNWCKVLQT